MQVAFNIDTDDIAAIVDFAESIGAEFGVTSEGRLVMADVKNVDEIVASQPFERFYVEKLDDTTLGMKF
jgi:hypothetical protein